MKLRKIEQPIAFILIFVNSLELARNIGHRNASGSHEGKTRPDCNESNQSKDCSAAAKSSQRVQTGTSSATTVPTSGNQNKQRQTQQHNHHHHKSAPVLRRKVNANRKQPAKSSPVPTASRPQQQVINRARGTLHGLSTIKRHGNVRVT